MRRQTKVLLWALLATSIFGGYMEYVVWTRGAPSSTTPLPIPENPVAARKARFINHLLPIIQTQNREIFLDRTRIKALRDALSASGNLPEDQKQWLFSMSDKYRLAEPDRITVSWLDSLLRRVDIVPADLALAQAAIESGWGRSRFAREGHNYFGQWCFSPGCGIVPSQRKDGATHEVQSFKSASESVARYMLNLNSHPVYRVLREIRANERRMHQPVEGLKLARGLEEYSEQGHEYVKKIRITIRNNDLSRFSPY